MPKVAVVILNWNGIRFLERYLPSVIDHTNPSLADIYVADNGSTDNSVKWLRENYPNVKIILLDRNYGFAEGYNLAFRQITSTYYLLLNSDVEVTSGWLEPLVELLDSEPSVAACMPKIRSDKERLLFEYAGAAGGFIDKFGYPFCRGRIFNHIEPDLGQYNNSIDIFWASGACMLIRSDLYFSAGGLDPFFFAHMEEIDLCWRIKNMGYRIMFCHQSTIFHFGGGTLPKNKHRKTYLNFRNNLIILIKNLSSEKFLRILIIRIFLDFVAAAFFLLKLDPGETFAVIRAHISVFSHWRKIFRSRKELLKKIQPLQFKEIYPHIIVFEFYLKSKKEFNKLGFY